MSSLDFKEKALLGDDLEMDQGYVSDFSNPSFTQFFASHDIDIYSDKYGEAGGSKANRLRDFWRLENDPAAGTIHLILRCSPDRVLLWRIPDFSALAAIDITCTFLYGFR